MAVKQPSAVLGFYSLDGVPVRLCDGHRPETWQGVPVEWTDWIYRAIWISREEYDALAAKAGGQGSHVHV